AVVSGAKPEVHHEREAQDEEAEACDDVGLRRWLEAVDRLGESGVAEEDQAELDEPDLGVGRALPATHIARGGEDRTKLEHRALGVTLRIADQTRRELDPGLLRLSKRFIVRIQLQGEPDREVGMSTGLRAGLRGTDGL